MDANVAFLAIERESSADWIDLSLISRPESHPEPRMHDEIRSRTDVQWTQCDEQPIAMHK
jgi:hypothetical protein